MRTIVILLIACVGLTSCSKNKTDLSDVKQIILSTQRFGCTDRIKGFCIKDYVEIDKSRASKGYNTAEDFSRVNYFSMKLSAEKDNELRNLVKNNQAFQLSKLDSTTP